MCRLEIANWPANLGVTTSASLYALASDHRVEGALLAHEAGYWVHADIILQADADGHVVNRGVEVSQVIRCLELVPEMRVDVHVMVLSGTDGWEEAVDVVVAQLRGRPVKRWSASAAILDRLRGSLPSDVARWVEVWVPRDGVPTHTKCDGALVMLIEPGTKAVADPAALDAVRHLASTLPVGVDGGVTNAIAGAIVEAGAQYAVIGRALFALRKSEAL